MTVPAENLGCIRYDQALILQEKYVEDILSAKRDEVILFCSHPPVVTLGKHSSSSEIQLWKGAVHTTPRGGKATYHGPGQTVCYPILNLKNRKYNLGGLLNALELAVVETLKEYSLKGSINPRRGDPQKTGVWVEDKKIASIGLAVKKWISYHGLAVNLFEDSLAFQNISPCGENPDMMISIEKILGKKPNREKFENQLYKNLLNYLPEIS